MMRLSFAACLVSAGAAFGADAKPDSKSQAAPFPTAPLSRKLPDGVLVVDVKMPKSLWSTGYYGTAKVGDWVEYEAEPAPGFTTKTKREVFDIGSDGFVELTTTSVAGMDVKSAIKYVFTEPDPAPVENKDGKPETKTSAEKVKVGDKELTTEVSETYLGDRSAKTWISKEVPLGGLVKMESGGKVVVRLTAFGRGK